MTENIKSTKYIGDLAEDEACKYLVSKQYSILERNWRTRYCEIDIVAKKNNLLYFIEVKYRHNQLYGSGLEVVNKKKQQQMTFAAQLWLSANKLVDNNAYLAVVGLSGSYPKVDSFVIID